MSSFRRTILLELKSSVTLRSAVLRFIFSQIMRLLKPCTTLTQSRITRCTMIKWRCDTNTFALAMWISHSFSKSAEQQNITQTSDFILRRGFQNEDSTHTHTEFFAMASHRQQITLSTASENMAKVWLCFLLDFRDTPHKLTASFQHQLTGIFTSDSRQQTKSHGNHLAFFLLPEGELVICTHAQYRPLPLPLVPWKFKNYWWFPHTLVKTGYAKQQVINTTTVARSLCRYAGKFLSTMN